MQEPHFYACVDMAPGFGMGAGKGRRHGARLPRRPALCSLSLCADSTRLLNTLSSTRQAASSYEMPALTQDAQPLFGGAIHAITVGRGWTAWTPLQPAVPAEHSTGAQCESGTLRLRSWPEHAKLAPQPMCLPANDRVAAAIHKTGKWYDCHQFVRMWNSAERSPSCQGSEAVLVEVGANIGACTVELLLRTRARIIAFEPSPTNLFFLTRSLRLAAAQQPDIQSRVIVFPIGVGNVALEHAQLYTERGNLGNTVVGIRHADACNARDHACLSRTMRATHETTILPLDSVFPHGLGCARLMKLDVQGFECKVLAGAQRALRTSQLRAVAAETTNTVLGAQCCSGAYLRHQLRVQPGWNVSCTSNDLCLGRGPGAKAMPLLWSERPTDPHRQKQRWRCALGHGLGRFECTPPTNESRRGKGALPFWWQECVEGTRGRLKQQRRREKKGGVG